MFQLLVNLAAILGGVAAAAQISESVAKGRRARKLKRQVKRATVTPQEAMRSFRRAYPKTRVKLGRFDNDTFVIVVRQGDVAPVGRYMGYQVLHAPEHFSTPAG